MGSRKRYWAKLDLVLLINPKAIHSSAAVVRNPRVILSLEQFESIAVHTVSMT
jgi:hypothetical protein